MTNPCPPGTKYDGEKPRWQLLPFDALNVVAQVLTFGARKYAPDNWRHVDDGAERYVGAALRHIAAWKCGARDDPESGLHHLGHAACCVLFALALEVTPRTVPPPAPTEPAPPTPRP